MSCTRPENFQNFPLAFFSSSVRTARMMLGQRHCPFCTKPSSRDCLHLALAVEAREFVRSCVEKCHGQSQWERLCNQRRSQLQRTGEWSPERDDFTWLETAFCEEFLKRLRWFGGMDYEWRTGPRPEQGGFWVLLWSKDPKRLWWALRDELERQSSLQIPSGGPPRYDNFLPL